MRPLASRPCFAAAALALFAIHTIGCATWHSAHTEHPAEFIAREKPDVVRFSVGESSLVLSRP
ncbi:MAG TPA: hypothetical protein VK527_09775, partial [Candidatus Limnocylindrales bacterium]|nr:hypothetical protein [Candidatus Limnocylindrales bacterium]